MTADKIDFSGDDAKKMFLDHVRNMTPEQIRDYFRVRGRDPDALIAKAERDFQDAINKTKISTEQSKQ